MRNTRSHYLNTPDAVKEQNRPAVAPLQYAGKWVAWDWERTKVIAHGDSMTEVDAAAMATGQKYVLQKLSRPEVIFIGAA